MDYVIEEVRNFKYHINYQSKDQADWGLFKTIDINNVTIDKTKINPGDKFNLTFELVNIEDYSLYISSEPSGIYLGFVEIDENLFDELGYTVSERVLIDPREGIIDQREEFNLTVNYEYPLTYSHSSFDADSILHFLEQYDTKKVTTVGDLPSELTGQINSLGLTPQIISPNDYFSYWKSYDNIVYVEDDYQKSLMASVYASLRNVPLVIEGTSLDTGDTFTGKDVILVGSVSCPSTADSCNERYTNLEDLEKEYVTQTNTDKIILVNPSDLDISRIESLTPDKSSNPIIKTFTKTSLAAPILASAKQEVIISTTSTDYEEIDNFIENKIGNLGINPEYLTIIGAPNVIPNKVDNRALDQTQYADRDGDRLPDIYAGRIQGITISDVSTNLARDIFYHEIERTDNMKFMASSFAYMIDNAESWATKFNNAGYNATAVTNPSNFYNFNPTEWFNQHLISYNDHGSAKWSGIKSRDIPYLYNSLIFSDACSTCSTYDTESFCNMAIRKGALSYVGAVSIAYAGNTIYGLTMNNIYYNNKTLGEAFTDAFTHACIFSPANKWMVTLLGDPTLDIKPHYYLDESLYR